MRPLCCFSSTKRSTSSISTVTVKLSAVPASLPAPRRGLVRQCNVRRDEARHALGELDTGRLEAAATLGRRHQQRRMGIWLVREAPAVVAREMNHRALGKRGDRQQRIDAQADAG